MSYLTKVTFFARQPIEFCCMNFISKMGIGLLLGWFTITSAQAQTAGSSILTNKNNTDGSILLSSAAQIYPLLITGSATTPQGKQQLHQGQILPHLYQAKTAQAALLVNAYPNPCNQVVHIDVLNSDTPLHHAILLDVTGKKVQQPHQYLQGKTLVLQLNDVCPGVYTLALFQENSAQAAAHIKLIKQ